MRAACLRCGGDLKHSPTAYCPEPVRRAGIGASLLSWALGKVGKP